jgi:hypothetical protein
MKNAVRFFIAPWYLIGWILHAYLAVTNPGIYRAFGSTALIPAFRELWQAFIMPNIVFFALILAAFEFFVGLLIIGKWEQVKYGLVASILFNLFLVQLGLSAQGTDWVSDVLMNRLPNLFFIAIQIPLLFSEFDRSLFEAILVLFRRHVHV